MKGAYGRTRLHLEQQKKEAKFQEMLNVNRRLNRLSKENQDRLR